MTRARISRSQMRVLVAYLLALYVQGVANSVSGEALAMVAGLCSFALLWLATALLWLDSRQRGGGGY